MSRGHRLPAGWGGSRWSRPRAATRCPGLTINSWCRLTLFSKAENCLPPMQRGPTSTFRATNHSSEEEHSFRPLPLPPAPALDLAADLQQMLERAYLAVGQLDSVSTLLPDTHFVLYNNIRKEALLSSQIGGTKSSLPELLLSELGQVDGAPPTTSSKCRITWPRWNTGSRAFARAFRSATGSSLESMADCSRDVAAARSHGGSSGSRRTESLARDPARRTSCRRRPMTSPSACSSSNGF